MAPWIHECAVAVDFPALQLQHSSCDGGCTCGLCSGPLKKGDGYTDRDEQDGRVCHVKRCLVHNAFIFMAYTRIKLTVVACIGMA